jgi:hypothetical protein
MTPDELRTHKAFLKGCLEDLEPLTGLRQLYFLQVDEDGKRKVDVLISGMLEACKKFDYIPLEAQQKIIRRMMVEDQKYDSLNSRTVFKWLTMAATAYRTHSQFSEEDLTPRDENGNPTEAAPPEVAEKYIQQLQASLAQIGNPLVGRAEEILKDVKRKETGRQKFVIDGIEVWATSETEAQKAFNATFK